MITREAIILAGGLGTRLQDTVAELPKCMAPVCNKPFLTFVLDYLAKNNIHKVILSVGFRKDHIINYFKSEYNSVSIDYAVEDEPLGTGGAVKNALRKCKGKSVFILNGDTCFGPDLTEMEKQHLNSDSDITIAVKLLQDTKRFGMVITDQDERILEFREKDESAGEGLINGGIYLINRKIIEEFQKQKFSLETDVFKESVSKIQIHAFLTDSFFLDIGIPEDYLRAQSELTGWL